MTTESVKVIVRCRPLIGQELKNKCRNIVTVDKGMQQISILDPQDDDAYNQKTFRFDEVFDINSGQQQVYDEAAFQIIEAASEGYNGNFIFFIKILKAPFSHMARQVVEKLIL